MSTGREVAAAAARLRGHIVATPLIGGLRLPGRTVATDLRVKPETLQPGGSIWFRGATHWLQRQLGAHRGVVVAGSPRRVLAFALAGEQHRVPVIACCEEPLPGAIARAVHELGCQIRSGHAATEVERVRAESGFAVAPDATNSDFAIGLATVGLELASELPGDAARVVVGDPALAGPIAQGLAEGRATAQVVAVERVAVPAEFADEVRTGLRLDVGDEGLAALWHALSTPAEGSTCAVLTS